MPSKRMVPASGSRSGGRRGQPWSLPQPDSPYQSKRLTFINVEADRPPLSRVRPLAKAHRAGSGKYFLRFRTLSRGSAASGMNTPDLLKFRHRFERNLRERAFDGFLVATWRERVMGAIQWGQKALQLDPDFARTHFWLGRAYAQKRMYPEAVSEAEKVLQGMPDSTLALTELAYSLGTAGRYSEARKLLLHLEERSMHTFVPAYDLAVIHVALNENDRALSLLQKSYAEHDWALLALAAEPRLDPLRRDPRYRELSKRLGWSFPAP